MDWIEQNLDAYRVIAEILTDLRPLVRERLESHYGREWFRDGIPEAIFERLIQSKEQEASIDWYENRYQEVISYAVFADLFEIINANPELFGPILKLAPSPSLLNTRFLELEVMRSKIGRAREVSESEINFLTSFHLRFRRAVEELRGAPAGRDGRTAETAAAPDTGHDEVSTDAGAATADDAVAGAASGAVPENEISGETESSPPPKAPEPPARPPQRLASPSTPSGAAADPEAEPEPATDPGADTETEATPEADEDAPRETTSTILKRAMENGDDQAVLRELYREVTGIAEVIWTTDQVPASPAWDRVSTNPWYEKNFSKLELRPLSDFYELINQVRSKLQSGASKAEIQSFLNDSRFATILLALRDMFQKNNI